MSHPQNDEKFNRYLKALMGMALPSREEEQTQLRKLKEVQHRLFSNLCETWVIPSLASKYREALQSGQLFLRDIIDLKKQATTFDLVDDNFRDLTINALEKKLQPLLFSHLDNIEQCYRDMRRLPVDYINENQNHQDDEKLTFQKLGRELFNLLQDFKLKHSLIVSLIESVKRIQTNISGYEKKLAKLAEKYEITSSEFYAEYQKCEFASEWTASSVHNEKWSRFLETEHETILILRNKIFEETIKIFPDLKKCNKIFDNIHNYASEEKQIKEKLIKFYFPIIEWIANNHEYEKNQNLDVINHAKIGLLQALDHFDYKREYLFSSYAYWWINQAILRRQPS